MNAIDFICLIPFYISMLLEGLEDVEIVGKAGKIIRFLKILRIFRVYKMFKHFAGLQSLLYTLQQAYKELGLLLHIVGMALATINLHFLKGSVPLLCCCRCCHSDILKSNVYL